MPVPVVARTPFRSVGDTAMSTALILRASLPRLFVCGYHHRSGSAVESKEQSMPVVEGMEIGLAGHRQCVPGLAAVGAFDQTKVRWSVAAVCAGMPTAQEMIRSYDGESHEVLHEVADEFGVALPGESVHAVVRAGIQHAVGIHAHAVDVRKTPGVGSAIGAVGT
ncbi:hypothetical protein [Mycolicibacterium gilvum]|uniref:hypothetical protein n=1 Tax=Mycolicibacterium gilvum TaxID=1804 RepID=UPI001F1E2480|nr:hypothetical protein [Mycolicibacterium gilvum]